ncbi:MAG: hypothetical protein ACFFG0_11080 [Candidatus Thorarchaeota archaeon]
MAFLNPTIMGGDFQIDVESEILSIFNVSYVDYFDNDRRMNATTLEENLDLVVTQVRNHVSHLAYHVLGFIIIRSGVKVSRGLKDEILSFIDWELDKKVGWGGDWVEARKFYLEDLRNKLKSHKVGISRDLIDLKLSRFFNFGTISAGLDQLNRNFRVENFDTIEHINLDTRNLLEFPEQVLSLISLKTLSLEHNMLS